MLVQSHIQEEIRLAIQYPKGHAHSTYAKRGRGGVLPLRTPLHKCDVTYVVSPAYKGEGGVSKSPEILRTYYVHAPLCAIQEALTIAK